MKLSEFNQEMANRRHGKWTKQIEDEEVKRHMAAVAGARMPWQYKGGRPRTVMCSGVAGCSCIDCRRSRGHYPPASNPPEVQDV